MRSTQRQGIHPLRHLLSLPLPILLTLVFPYFILRSEGWFAGGLVPAPSLARGVAGAAIMSLGFGVMVATIRMFIRLAHGTIMPWDPTRKLVTSGLYGHVRNPMILGVITVELGEAVMFASRGVFFLALGFFVLNQVYFRVYEEPSLEARFGEEYREYMRNVPRWIPRRKSWQP